MASWLAGIGLVLGFAGAVLMFRFGVPSYPQKSRAGSGSILLESTDEAEKQTVRRADLIGKTGVGLLATGFLLQLIALFID